MDKNPMYLMLPISVASGLAFMLPVGTPPNALVFASGKLKVVDMVLYILIMQHSICASVRYNILDWSIFV